MRLQTIYRLSASQQKRLLISNIELVIAIPFPVELDEDFDPNRVIGLAMPEHYQFCQSAECRLLPVMMPGFGEGESVTKGMQGTIGRILRDHEQLQQHPRPVIHIECVVAKLVPPSKRSKPGPKGMISWPGKMFHHGLEVEAQVTPTQLAAVDPDADPDTDANDMGS